MWGSWEFLWISFGNFLCTKNGAFPHFYTSNMSICLIASGELLPPRPRLLPPDDVQTPVVEDETEDRARWVMEKNPGCFTGMLGMKSYLVLCGDYIYPVRKTNQDSMGKSKTKQIMVFRIIHVKDSLLSTNGQSLVSGVPILQEVARDLNSHGQEYALN